MLKQPAIEKLKDLRLEAMAAAWLEQQKKPDLAKLDFDERLGMLVDAEWLHREKRVGRCLKEAKLRIGQACVEDSDYPARRELDRAVIRQLATCRWIDEHQNVVITGMAAVRAAASGAPGRSGTSSTVQMPPTTFEISVATMSARRSASCGASRRPRLARAMISRRRRTAASDARSRLRSSASEAWFLIVRRNSRSASLPGPASDLAG